MGNEFPIPIKTKKGAETPSLAVCLLQVFNSIYLQFRDFHIRDQDTIDKGHQQMVHWYLADHRFLLLEVLRLADHRNLK
jgi:hypothetical protein